MGKEFAGSIYFRGPGSKKKRASDWGEDEIPSHVLKKLPLVGTPILQEHKREWGPVGKITEVWYDKYDGCHAKFEISDPFLATFVDECNKGPKTFGRGLSVSHRRKMLGGDKDEYEVTEVSVCNRNARYGCVISDQMTPEQYKVHTLSADYNAQTSLKDPLNKIHVKNAVKASLITMESHGPSGTPHVNSDASTAPAATTTAASSANTPTGSGVSSAPPPDAPTNQEVYIAVTSSGAPPEDQLKIFTALDAQMDVIAQKEKEIAALQEQLSAKQTEIKTVQASATRVNQEHAAFLSTLNKSVQRTVEAYFHELADGEGDEDPELIRGCNEQMQQLLAEKPTFAPVIEVFARAVKSCTKRRHPDELLEAKAAKFLSRPLAYARPDQQVRSIAVEASAAGKPMAKVRAPEGGTHVPRIFGSGDRFARYMAAADLDANSN